MKDSTVVTRRASMSRKCQKKAKKAAKQRNSAYLKYFTVAVFGEAKVGKTCLVRSFVGEDFTDRYEPTIEDFYSTQIGHDEKNYQFDIIDTCGSENFPAMRRVDIEKADAIVLVYSLDKPNSFEYLKDLREEILQEKGYSIPVVVVANKSDVVLDGHALEITNKDGRHINTKAVAEKEWKLSWTLTSAKMQWGVKDLFLDLLDQAISLRRNYSLPTKRRETWLNRNLTVLRRRSSK